MYGRGESRPSGGGASLRRRKERAAVYPLNEPSLSNRDKTLGGVLLRTEEDASSRVSIDTSSSSLLIHLVQSAQPYICQGAIHLGKKGFLGWRPSRAEERPRGEQPCVDRYAINLINNPSRPERAAVYLSMNYSSRPEKAGSSGGGEHLGQRKERALERRGKSRAENRANRDKFIKIYSQSQAEKTSGGALPRAEQEGSRRMSIDTSPISVS